MIEISAVIPTVNRKNILKRTIEALFEQTYPKDKYEIVVVDDGSTDGTEEMVKDFVGVGRDRPLPIIQYLRQIAGIKGPAAANNLGIRSASGKYILFMNDDVIADDHLIEEHMASHVKTRLIASQPTESEIIIQGRVINTSSLEDLTKKHKGYAGGYSDLSLGYFTTWNCSISKDLLFKAGLFDEEFRNLCWEDVEFGYRLRKLGIKQKYNKMAFGYHFRHEFNLKQLDWVRTKSINMGGNAMIYYRKHPVLEVKISTQSFWLPFALHSFLGIIIRSIGKEKILAYMHSLEKRNKARLLQFLVGLAGWYWYIIGVKEKV